MRRAGPALALLLAACGRSGDPRPQAADDAGFDAGADAGAHETRLIEPGREPRSRAAFAFVPDRTESATLVLESRLTRGGDRLGEERVRLRLRVKYTTRDTVELTVREAETTAPDIPGIGSTIGARFVQKFDAAGRTDVPEMTFPPASDPRAADYVRGAVVQVASNLLPVVPAEAVGDGARWVHGDLRFTVVAPPGRLLEVERRSGQHGPTRMETGETVFVSEEQTYRIEAPADGIARHVEALLVAAQPGETTRTTTVRFDIEAP